MGSTASHTCFSFSDLDRNYWGKFHILLRMVLQDSEVLGVQEIHTRRKATISCPVSERLESLTASGNAVIRSRALEPFLFGTDKNAGDHVRIVPTGSEQQLSGFDNDTLIVMAWLLILLDDYPERIHVKSTAPLYQWERALRLALGSGYTKLNLPIDVFAPRDVYLIDPPARLDFRA